MAAAWILIRRRGEMEGGMDAARWREGGRRRERGGGSEAGEADGIEEAAAREADEETGRFTWVL
jgi:hypothetical protein